MLSAAIAPPRLEDDGEVERVVEHLRAQLCFRFQDRAGRVSLSAVDFVWRHAESRSVIQGSKRLSQLAPSASSVCDRDLRRSLCLNRGTPTERRRYGRYRGNESPTILTSHASSYEMTRIATNAASSAQTSPVRIRSFKWSIVRQHIARIDQVVFCVPPETNGAPSAR
jgi:hypothetical protein